MTTEKQMINTSLRESPTTAHDAMEQYAIQTQQNESPYFYHSDHPGSASWITDAAVIPVQHLQYLPFGEPFVNQRASGSNYNEPFTFTGKEWCKSQWLAQRGPERGISETGYSYFGARYYDSDLSGLFLSVDPMADKYPSISPYAYCAWNPVKYIDPNGEWIPGLDENNNVILTAEDGDDINTLRDFMGDAYRDVVECLYGTMNNGVINLTESYGCIFQEMTDAINDSPTNDVNCWGTSMSILTNGVIDPHYRFCGEKIAKGMYADVILIANGISVPKSDANVGNTLVRFSNSGENGQYPGETTHFATYMGTDSKGQQYVFTKN